MFGKIVMYLCLTLLAGLVPALAVVWMHGYGIRPLMALVGRFKKLPLSVRLVAIVLAADLIVYGSTKSSTNTPPGGVSGDVPGSGTNEPSSMVMLTSDEPDPDPRGFTTDEINAGVVRTWIRTGEAWRFDLAPGATVVEPWRLRGAAEDEASIPFANLPYYVFSNGRLQDEIRNPQVIYAPLQGSLGVVPEANWNRIASSNATSRVWFDESEEGAVTVTWQDVLLARETNMPISLQTAFDGSGRIVYRYDLSHADPSALEDVWTGVRFNGRELSVPMGTNVTSVGWYRLHPDDAGHVDRDGDGLSTRDEVFVHDTDPGRADTDCDGIPDGEEVARHLDPLDADSDHDGFVDGSDPDPLVPTSPEDRDGDGLPDAYEYHWFGDTNVWDSTDGRDATGFTLGTKFRTGMNPTNAASCLRNVSTNELASWKLWDGFSMQWPRTQTNLVYERTIAVERTNPLLQCYLSSEPDAAGAWFLSGMQLEISWQEGTAREMTLAASPHADSFRIPFGSNAVSSVTFRLRATGPVVGSRTPVYLIAHAPKIRITGGRELVLDDGTKAHVFTKGSESRIGIAVDRSKRPCRAPLSAEERDLSGLGDVATDGMSGFRYEGTEDGGMIHPDGTGIYDFPLLGLPGEEDASALRHAPSSRSSRARNGKIVRLIVIMPTIGWNGVHLDGCLGKLNWNGDVYAYEVAYPLDSECLIDGWNKDATGGHVCTCEPEVLSGLGDCPYVMTTCTRQGEKASGNVLVNGHIVWSGSAEHLVAGGWGCKDDLAETGPCASCEGCENGNCDKHESLELGSLKFRIPLGVPRKDQVSGFLYVDTETPVRITPAAFDLLCREDADVTAVTNGADRLIVCGDERGRTLAITSIENGVRIRITTTATGVHEHTWEIVHVDGDLNTIRFHKISRQNNTMKDWTAAYAYEPLRNSWTWRATDNVAGVREELSVENRLNEEEASYTEHRDRYTADGTWLGGIVRRSERIGEGAASALRETYYCETSPSHDPIERHATYWRDTEHKARNGRLRLVTGDDRAWTYHTWTENGCERLRLVEREGGRVPETFPEVDDEGVLSGLGAVSNATLTVFGYDPLEGDAADPDENGLVRNEVRYVVRGGVATCIERKWHRFTHVLASGYAAVKKETWRAGHAQAEWNDPGNAYSYAVTFSESGEVSVPLALRGTPAERLDEDGVLSVTTASLEGNRVVTTTHRTFAGVAFPEYERVERDMTHGVELRHATCLEVDGTVIDETTRVFDDQNRLRYQTWLDGTDLTNAFSCCRLLWSRDRQGRTTLRSAMTGEDHLYWAEEEPWLGDARLRGETVGTNGPFRVTQHFRDAFGRETNCVSYAESLAGRAVDWTASAESEKTEDRTDYADLRGSDVLHVDARGKATSTHMAYGTVADEVTTHSWWEEQDLVETEVKIRNGARTVRKTWSGQMTETVTWTDYDAAGRRTDMTVTTSDDCGVVTNRVARYDFLGRCVSIETPEDTTEYVYAGTSGRQTQTNRTAGGVPMTTVMIYNDRGEAVGHEENDVCTRRDTGYENDGDGWWKVTREAIFADGVTNAVTETREQLTGRNPDVRNRVVDLSDGKIIGETVVSAHADGMETTTVSNALAGVTVITNLYGLTLSRTTADGTYRYTYDAFGRRVGVTRTVEGEVRPVQAVSYTLTGDIACEKVYTNALDGVEKHSAYNALGKRTSVTDALGGETVTSFDALGRETMVGGSAAYGVRYGYDSQGRRTSLATSRDGQTWDVTGWTYDAGTGRVLTKRFADGRTVSHAYTGDGLPERITRPSGGWRAYGYDAQRRCVTVTSDDGSVNAGFAYDAFGRKTEESNDVAAVTYVLAGNGLATNECQTVSDGAGHNVTCTFVRTFDDWGRVTGRGLADGPLETIAYTPENRVAAVTTPDVSVAYTYGSDGSETGHTTTIAGGATIRRVVVRDPYRGTVTAISNFVNGVSVRNQTFAYDALGRVGARDGDSFAYNARSELTGCVSSVSAATCTQASYAYDGIGNLTLLSRNGTVRPFVANEVNQYAGLSYTPDGELAGFEGVTYAYDAAGRLTGVSTGGVCVATYAYDTLDRRVRKVTSEATHLFFYDGWNLVREEIVSAAGTETVEYVWGRDANGSLHGTGGVGGLVCLKRGGNIYIPLYDANGNVLSYLDANGTVVAEYAYDGFGNCVMATAPRATDFHFRYSTKYADPESGLVYYGFRYCLPALGRWISRDPLEEQGGLNLYAFCGNNAVNRFDALGLIWGDRAYWKTEGVAYFVRNNCPWSAEFLKHSLQDSPEDLTFHMTHPFAALVKGSPEYKDALKNIVDSQFTRVMGYDKVRKGMNFTSHDLATTIAHAMMEYSGRICKDRWGGMEIDLTVRIYDTYDFHLAWFDPISQTKLLVGNTLARASQSVGVIVPYDWSVNFTEYGESY